MKKLLISGLGGSFFPYLHKQLESKFKLYYVDNNINLKNVYPDYNFHHVPLVTDLNYLNVLEEIIHQNEIDAYLPLIDEEIEHIIKRFSNTLIVIAPNLDFVKLCLNKYDLMAKLEENNLSVIKTYTADNYSEELKYPIFLKPISGRGSRGIFKIDNKEQYDAYFKLYNQYLPSDILIQENIIGQEYTIGVLTNNLGDLMVVNSKKVLSKKGITQMAVTEVNDLITSVIKRIVLEIKPKGPFNVQLFITSNNEIKIFEINPRFSTTTIMSYAANIDEVSLFLDHYDKKYSSKILEPKEGLNLYRRWESLFYDN